MEQLGEGKMINFIAKTFECVLKILDFAERDENLIRLLSGVHSKEDSSIENEGFSLEK